MTSKQLGRIEQIRDIRKYWESEATDLTPWLSEGENLNLLGDTIGIELGLEAQKKNVGPFRASPGNLWWEHSDMAERETH